MFGLNRNVLKITFIIFVFAGFSNDFIYAQAYSLKVTYTVCTDVLNIRAQPTIDGKIIGKLNYRDEVEFLDEISSDKFQIKLRPGNSEYDNKKYSFNEAFIKIRDKNKLEGWVYGGCLLPPKVPNNDIHIIGRYKNQRFAYFIRTSNTACDGEGILGIYDIKTDKVIFTTGLCGNFGDPWASDYNKISKALKKYKINRTWIIDKKYLSTYLKIQKEIKKENSDF